ncbi:porin family protein [soil metagenome]
MPVFDGLFSKPCAAAQHEKSKTRFHGVPCFLFALKRYGPGIELGARKKMKFVSAIAVAGGLLISSQAYSADLPARPYYKAAPIAYLPWNKCYVGITAGYTPGTGGSDSDPRIRATSPGLQDSIDLGNVPSRLASDPDGGVVGGTIGCNRQYDRVVIGGEADLMYSSMRDSVAVIQGAGVTTTFDRKLDAIGTLRARLGYAIDNTLLYVTGGLAYGHVKSNAQIFSVPGASALAGGEDAWKAGWTLGGGIEHMFMPNWSVKAEYLYYDLGNSDVNLLPVGGPPETGVLSYKNTGHIIRAGLNYHFAAY